MCLTKQTKLSVALSWVAWNHDGIKIEFVKKLMVIVLFSKLANMPNIFWQFCKCYLVIVPKDELCDNPVCSVISRGCFSARIVINVYNSGAYYWHFYSLIIITNHYWSLVLVKKHLQAMMALPHLPINNVTSSCFSATPGFRLSYLFS